MRGFWLLLSYLVVAGIAFGKNWQNTAIMLDASAACRSNAKDLRFALDLFLWSVGPKPGWNISTLLFG